MSCIPCLRKEREKLNVKRKKPVAPVAVLCDVLRLGASCPFPVGLPVWHCRTPPQLHGAHFPLRACDCQVVDTIPRFAPALHRALQEDSSYTILLEKNPFTVASHQEIVFELGELLSQVVHFILLLPQHMVHCTGPSIQEISKLSLLIHEGAHRQMLNGEKNSRLTICSLKKPPDGVAGSSSEHLCDQAPSLPSLVYTASESNI